MKSLQAVGPKTFGVRACFIGFASLAMVGFHLALIGRTFGHQSASTDAFDRFLQDWVRYLMGPQIGLSSGLIVFGFAFTRKREWGRRGILTLLRLLLWTLPLLLVGMEYGFFLFFRDKWIPNATRTSEGGRLFAYGTAVLFIAWSLVVAGAMLWYVVLLIRRVKAPDFSSWTQSRPHPPGKDPS